jgi:hypothetical protein
MPFLPPAEWFGAARRFQYGAFPHHAPWACGMQSLDGSNARTKLVRLKFRTMPMKIIDIP